MPSNSHESGVEATGAHTAADAGGHEPKGILSPDPGVAIYTFITFVLLFFILKKLAWKPMLLTLDKREQAIRESVTAAERAQAAAASSLEEQQKLLAEARREAQELLLKSRADADRAREEIVAKARTEAEKVIEAGRKAIEQEKLAALDDMRKATVELTLAATSKVLRKRIDDAQSRELVQTYVKELEQSAARERRV